ncbi:MAG: STAS domain-containing protein [Candidatus Dormibacteria bacterium]
MIPGELVIAFHSLELKVFSSIVPAYSHGWEESMDITTRTNGVARIVDVIGDITLDDAPDLLKALMDLLKAKKASRVVVNLTNVRYIDSAGVACLVEALKVSRELKLGFALFGLSRVAKEVFELTRLIRVFEVYDTEEEALRGVQPTSSGATS